MTFKEGDKVCYWGAGGYFVESVVTKVGPKVTNERYCVECIRPDSLGGEHWSEVEFLYPWGELTNVLYA